MEKPGEAGGVCRDSPPMPRPRGLGPDNENGAVQNDLAASLRLAAGSRRDE